MSTTIHTRAGMTQGAIYQYRAYFRTMALGGAWHVYIAPPGETLSGVIVAPEGDMPRDAETLVRDVQAMAEDTLRVKMNNALMARAID